jgi:hypothetical protein
MIMPIADQVSAVTTVNYGFLMMLAAAPVWAGQLVIHLPQGVPSETAFIRYVRAGEKFGGWVRSRAGVSSYAIDTSILINKSGAVPAIGLKAVIYAPGCAIQTVDLRLSSPKDEEYSFLCKPLATVRINGRLIEARSLRENGALIQARYIARWAHNFLGLTDDSVLVIPVGETESLSADGHFAISVPDLFHDQLAGSADGDLQFRVKDKAGENLLAQLVAKGATRLGGLKILSEYPSELVFAACGVKRAPIHDNGFARRSDLNGCQP